MNDDWRLRVDLHKDEFAELLTASTISRRRFTTA
jgi:hypothetical protein